MRTAVLLAVLSLGGCTLTVPEQFTLSFLQLPAGEDVQTQTDTVIGTEIAPTGPEGPRLRLGYIRGGRTRVPGYDADTYVPDVTSTHEVDAETGVVIKELLEVGARE